MGKLKLTGDEAWFIWCATISNNRFKYKIRVVHLLDIVDSDLYLRCITEGLEPNDKVYYQNQNGCLVWIK